MSIFLMGCFDSAQNVWCTVTKVHGGHDDKTLERLQVKKQLFFIKIVSIFLHLKLNQLNNSILNIMKII